MNGQNPCLTPICPAEPTLGSGLIATSSLSTFMRSFGVADEVRKVQSFVSGIPSGLPLTSFVTRAGSCIANPTVSLTSTPSTDSPLTFEQNAPKSRSVPSMGT